MRVQAKWWMVPAIAWFAVSAQAADCSTLSGCSVKQCEIENLIEQARKEGNMRRLSTLKDLRTEALRCEDTAEKKKEG